MKYFRNTDGVLFAFELDGSQDSFIAPELVPLTEAEAFPPPTPEEAFQALVKQFDNAVEAHLHSEAVSHGYTNIERACMYAPVPNPYEAESRSFVEWVGSVWAYCYQELQKVQAGTRPVPTVELILSELPTRVIPS